MRTEKEIYDLVLNFAFQDERIRIVTLEGSRTNVNIPKDNLQDYDITFFVIDMGEFLKSDDWLSVFGNRLNYPDYDENVTKYLETQKRISNKYLYGNRY